MSRWGILKFKLSEDEDAFKLAINASNYESALNDISTYLRTHTKYHDESSGLHLETVEKIREEFFNIVSNNDISL